MMLVVDASIAVKWTVDEDGSEAARAVLLEGADLRAPTLVLVEVHNALAKRFNRREIAFNQFADAIHYLRTVVALLPLDENVVGAAWQISLGANMRPGPILPVSETHAFSIYDSIYIAAALELDAHLVTADAKQAEVAERFGVTVRRLPG